MSVYKLELEKASIIIKKETIINPPPVIETVDIPDGVTFGYSDFSDIENLKKVLPYINNGNYGKNIFCYCKFPKDIKDIEFRICKGSSAFYSVTNTDNRNSGSIIVNCERILEDDSMQFMFNNCRLNTVTFKNTGHIKRFYTINGSYGDYYGVDTFKGLDLSNCIELYFAPVSYSFDFYADNFGKHPDFISYQNISYQTKDSVIYSYVDNSFDRAAAGYEPCTIKYISSELTDEQIAKATSKGYTITT